MVEVKQQKTLKPFLRVLFICFGILSVTIGIIGIVVPVLPTTPFLLLAAFFFVRSSNKLYHWLLNHKILGNYLYNYIHYKAISPWVKVFTLSLLWTTISLSILLVEGKLWLNVLLLIVAISVSIHVIKLRTLKKEKK